MVRLSILMVQGSTYSTFLEGFARKTSQNDLDATKDIFNMPVRKSQFTVEILRFFKSGLRQNVNNDISKDRPMLYSTFTG